MKTFSLISISIVSATVSMAATVNWSAVPNAGANVGLVDNSAAPLAAGNWLQIGYFTGLSDSQITADALTSSGLSILSANFHLFDSNKVGSGTGNTAGTFNIASSPSYSTLTGFTPSSQIYLWALKSSNTTSLSNALSSATETAIVYVPFSSLASWQFPASDVAAGPTISLSDIANSNAKFLAGSYQTNVASLNPPFGASNHALKLSAVSSVPEPSTLTFGMMAALGAIGSRWRRNK